jgi:hypothetical protein
MEMFHHYREKNDAQVFVTFTRDSAFGCITCHFIIRYSQKCCITGIVLENLLDGFHANFTLPIRLILGSSYTLDHPETKLEYIVIKGLIFIRTVPKGVFDCNFLR